MMTLVFFLEELSAKRLLENLLPRMFPEKLVTMKFVVFEGKQDLEKRIVLKMRHWLTPNTRFIVLRDQDSADCQDIKDKLVDRCRQAQHPEALVRVACREIESWYLGDLRAVEQGLGIKNIAKEQQSRKFRDPDRLENPSTELQRLTGQRYQKVSGSRAIAPYLKLDGSNRSHSFRVFITGVQRMVEQGMA